MKTKFLAIILLSIFSSCGKDKDSSTDILISRTWSWALNDKNPSTNPSGRILYYAVPNCEKDDTFRFTLDGKLIVNRSADKCDPDELQNETQSYTLNRAAKELVIHGNKFTLAEESGSQIKYYAPLGSGTGYDYMVFVLQ